MDAEREPPPTPAGRPRVAPLVRLELRRGLRALAPALALAATLALLPRGGDAAPLLDSHPSAAGELTRQAVWGGGLALTLALACAHLARGPRRSEAHWLRTAPLAPVAPALARTLGTGLAGALVLAGVAGLAEVRGSAGPALRPTVGLDTEVARRLAPDERWAVAVDPGPTDEGAVLHVSVAAALGRAPTTEVELRLERAGPDGTPAVRSTTRRVTRRERVECPLPPGAGPVRVELRVLGPGDLVVVPGRTIGLWVPAGSARRGSSDLWRRGVLALVALGALAQALGRHLGPVAACAGVFSLWCVARWTPLAAAWLPDGDLPAALSLVGGGRRAPALGLAPLGSTLACLALALALGARGSREVRP